MLPFWARYLQAGTCFFIFLVYISCVAALTVEAYVSVRSLPKGAYSSVEWASFFPHF